MPETGRVTNMKKIGRLLKFVLMLAIAFGGIFFLSEIFMGSVDGYNSEYIYVINREDKTVMVEKNATKKAYPASLVKIMTTLVALENIDDLSQVAPVDVETYQAMVNRNASMAGFYGRESTTYRDLLYGTMLASGGEAANSLAVNISGNVEAFVVLMNQKADDIGLKDTYFTNAEGLHDNKQVTTAHDMALLLDYALQNGDFRAIFTKPNFKTTSTPDHPDGIHLKSTVLSRLPHGEMKNFEIIGGKSGTTVKAGQCWAVIGTKNGKEYITIVMGAKLNDISNPSYSQIDDTIKIFNDIE